MASAVIRAMSFGALSSSSDDRGRGDPHQPSSRSSSKTRNSFSKTLSRESTLELDDSLGLERSLSRLSLMSSASGARAPGGGILINRSRPSSPQPPTTRSLSYESEPAASMPLSTSISSTSSLSDRHGRPLPPIRTHSSASTHTSSNEPLTPSSPGFATSTSQTSHATSPGGTPMLVREESVERKKPKIKFAPLPQIRPRSYSTGRNVWAEHDDEGDTGLGGEYGFDDEGGGPLGNRHLVRREDGKILPYYENGIDDDEEDEVSEDEDRETGGGFRFNPRRQSWTDSLGMGSVWGSSSSSNGHKRDKSRDTEDDTVSLGSSAGGGGGNTSDYGLSSSGGKEKEIGGVGKILKPFLFGRKKSIKSGSTSSAGRVSATLTVDETGGTGLSRQSSGDSQVSRRSTLSTDNTPGPTTPTNDGVRGKGTTGIPMRKASTRHSTNSAGSKGSNSTAKDKKQKRISLAAASTSPGPRDPASPQIIYYASPSRSSRPARRAQYPPVAQRSRTAPKPIRQSKVEEPEFTEWGSVGSVGSVSSRGAGPSRSAGDDDEDGSGMAWIKRRRREREEKEKQERELVAASAAAISSLRQDEQRQQQAQDVEVEIAKEPEEDKENEIVQRMVGRNPKRQSTVDSTFSMTSSTSTIRPASPKIMSGLSLSRPAREAEDDSPEAAFDGEESDEGQGVDDSDDESVDEDDEGEFKDDDLDADELAKEEALCDAARRTANCAGAERYHSTTHENVLHVPSDSIKRQPSQNLKRSNSDNSPLL